MPLEPKYLKRLKKALNKLKLSVAVKGILVDIANELHDIYEDAVKALQKENQTLKKHKSVLLDRLEEEVRKNQKLQAEKGCQTPVVHTKRRTNRRNT